MTRIIYVDGHYRPYAEAGVHAEDRGFQFGDAVYEVCEVRDRQLVDETRHIDRLARSLRELAIDAPMARGAWSRVLRETVRRNRVRNGLVYLQVSRGAAPRDFAFPPPGTPPTVVCLARSTSRPATAGKAARGIGVITRPDPRWARCDIKTVMLLPASLAKMEARADGAEEVWFLDRDGVVTEGGSSNAWILTAAGELVTRPAGSAILLGITRTTLIDLIARDGYRLVERGFSVADARVAREAFITSATNIVMPVVRIDGQPVGDGRPGPLAAALRAHFHDVAEIARR